MNKFKKILRNPWTIGVGVGVVVRLLDYFLELDFWESILKNLKLYVTVQVWVITLLIVVLIILLIIIYNLKKKRKQSLTPIDLTNIKNRAKYLRQELEFELLEYKELQVTSFIKPKWRSKEKPQNTEEFINEFTFSNPRCLFCKSDFYVDIRFDEPSIYECTNQDCKNRDKLLENYIEKSLDQMKGKFFGEIRNDFDKYWTKYLSLIQYLKLQT